MKGIISRGIYVSIKTYSHQKHDISMFKRQHGRYLLYQSFCITGGTKGYTEVELAYDQPSISPDRRLWHACKHYQPSIKIDLMFRTIWSRPGIVFGKKILNSKPIGPAFHLPRQTSTAAVLCRTIHYSLGNEGQWYKLSKTWCHSANAHVETQTPWADETSSYTQRSSSIKCIWQNHYKLHL